VNKRAAFLVSAAAVIALGSTVLSEAQAVKRIRLENGLVILTKPIRTNSIVSVNVSLRMGSLYETDDKAGLFTLMQNTILKGTKTRTSEQIAEEMESMGTRISSSADREYGTVSIQSTSESLYASLAVLYDVLRNATFPQDAVDLQKRNLKRNILARRDQPLNRAMELMVEAEYGTHPFHKPTMGYPETVGALTREDLLKSYAAAYVPNNMVISVVGNFNERRLIGDIRRALGGIVGTPTSAKHSLGTPPRGEALMRVPGDLPVHTAPVEKVEQREAAASWFALGWLSPSLAAPDYYAMEVLDAITGGSMNSRLFVAIREKRGLAYQVSSFVNARMETGIYAAYIGTKPESYEEAKSLLLAEIFRMKKEEASAEEISLAKSYLRGMFIMGQESNAGQAGQYGQYEILGLGHEFGDKYVAGIQKVTARDIMRVGGKYLTGAYGFGAVVAKTAP
jgi:predicted Zn-dependent peptidase